MEEIKKDRKKIIKVLSLIVSIVLIIALTTFAWITWQSTNNTELTMTIGQLAEVTFEKGNDISAGELVPVLDYNSGETTTFNINNKSTGYYRAYVTLNITSIDSELQNEHFKYIILKSGDNSTFEPVIEGTFKDIVVGSNNIGDILLYAKSKTYYKFIMYIDSNEENDSSMMGKTIEGSIVVEASNSEPNIPNISNGLIPVTYNGDTWVKADETNEDDSWYNYDEKKWANAVLVKEYDYIESITQSNKSVSIDNSGVTSNVYTSSNQGVNSSTSASTLTFTTGSTAGNLSFDYSVSSESNYDKYTIIINGTTVVSAISGTVSDTYTQSLNANTEYVITVSYVKDSVASSGNDQATISNIVLPSGSTSIVNAASGDYGWTESSVTTYNLNTYDSYTISDTGIYTISGVNNVSATDAVGKYICSDTTSTKCSEMYKITTVSGNTITAVDVYGTTTTSDNKRDAYKSASIGTEIPEEDVLAYYVWIPRYKYKVWNISKRMGIDSYNAQINGIDIIWERGIESSETITCKDYDFTVTDGSLSEKCNGSNGEYYTHPAFTFGDDELTGIWVGKFEISSEDPTLYAGGGDNINLSVRIKPSVSSWKYANLTNFSKVIQNMSLENNEYGLSLTSDSHMIKNLEWGAVAYLTHSGYGRCIDSECFEISPNSYSDGGSVIGATGCGPLTKNSAGWGNVCNKYNTELGQLASTTGNIYGIYDMRGGSSEYIMVHSSKDKGKFTYNSSNTTSSFIYSTTTAKYIDTYAYGTTYSDQTAYNRSRLGDAIGEVSVSTKVGWNKDRVENSIASYPWLIRGASSTGEGNASGIFSSDFTGSSEAYFSTRAVLIAP